MPNVFLTDWHDMHHRNTLEQSLIYLNALLWILLNCYPKKWLMTLDFVVHVTKHSYSQKLIEPFCLCLVKKTDFQLIKVILIMIKIIIVIMMAVAIIMIIMLRNIVIMIIWLITMITIVFLIKSMMVKMIMMIVVITTMIRQWMLKLLNIYTWRAFLGCSSHFATCFEI